MKRLSVIFMIVLSMVMTGCGVGTAPNDRLTVAVSIMPQETFVKAVAGDLVDVVTLIPPGASPANYQPSPREMAAFDDASIYFTIDVGAELANILPNVASQNDGLQIVDLAYYVDEIYEARYFGDVDGHEDEAHEEETLEEEHDHEGRDPHIWMSPKRVVVMIETIRDTLIEADPDNTTSYELNAHVYIEKLNRLDESLTNLFVDRKGEAFIVMHPSVGYFADDYDLEMIAIEDEGKEASVSHMQSVIDFARDNDIRVVFYQQEFDSTQAETIADEIDGEVIAYEPLSGDYIESMNSMAEAFNKVLAE